ncbi:MAG: asparagine synthase (glutamine-hydrolyzing) [Defluviitaleaceae bacterium]|nr:asparagine synthase (glutamine-hydrolyzing) [Defluviitaleaceae bacterium]
MKGSVTESEQGFIKKGVQVMSHRGPDDEGFYFNAHIAFGFKRLSFVDLVQGAQPYTTSDSHYTCLFNGEIYNHHALRTQLQAAGVTFDTHSEIEVIIELYRHQGDDFVKKLRGMFAIVLYDHVKQRIVAARDSFGIKPLYYRLEGDTLSLASELKAFKPEAGYAREALNEDALSHYFTFQYAPEDETAIKGIRHVLAGALLTYDLTSGLKIERYKPFKVIQGSPTSKTPASKVREAIMESVHAHLQAEVEIGTFLSGGIDSTIVASVAKKVNPNIKAFTIGYDLASHSEISDAEVSADALGIDLRTRKVSATTYMAAVRQSVYHMDSPQADPSAIMFYLLSEFAVREVKACLSGEGADELFGGYPIYKEVDGLKMFTKMPASMKKGLLAVSQTLPTGMKGKSFLERGSTPLRNRYAGNAFIFKEEEKANLLKFKGSHWQTVTDPLYDQIGHLQPLEQMQTIDLHTWLKGDILLKADRLSMAHSLEVRVPFLDDVVFDVATQLSKEEKIHGMTAKAILREAFDDYLPAHMKQMKKRGFPVPLAHWMRTELYEEIRDVLTLEVAVPFVDQKVSLALLEAHRMGKDNSRKIWTIMVFILWLDCYLNPDV